MGCNTGRRDLRIAGLSHDEIRDGMFIRGDSELEVNKAKFMGVKA